MLIKATLTILVLLLAVVPELSGSSSLATAQARQKQTQKSRTYACPMHPDVTSKRPGKCPRCGMTLRLVKHETVRPAATVAADVPASKGETSISPIRIPDVEIYDQTGRRLHFYTDLIKGKTVAINFIFTTCTTICPPLTATFRRVQQDLAEQKLPAQLISISVDPTTDTPERLLEFAAKFRAAPGWTFVTGDKAAIDSILQSLGASVADKNDHSPMILIGNDATGFWTRAYGLSSPTVLVQLISNAAGVEVIRE